MKPFLPTISPEAIRSEAEKIGLLLIVALIFALAVIDVLQFGRGTLIGISIRTDVFVAAGGEFTLPPKVMSLQFVLLFLFSIILAVLLPLLPPIAASLLVVVLAIPLVLVGLSEPFRNGDIPMQYSLLVLLMLFGTNVMLSYLSETRKKQAIIGIFSRYVPPDIVSEISKQPDLINLDGELKQLSIIFCDLRDFTGISERLEPPALVSLLNRYFTTMTNILHKHGATIDKYIGDSIMAFWGAPLPQSDHARRAVLAALEIHSAITELQQELTAEGLPATDLGIGINTGMVNVGNMGSDYRLAYTVIGDAVNLASRLERLTRIYQVPTIVGEGTALSLNDFVFRELDTLTVKGKSNRVRIYEPLGPKNSMREEELQELEEHRAALDLYYSGRHTEAIEAFRLLAGKSDKPAYYEYMLTQLNPDIREQA